MLSRAHSDWEETQLDGYLVSYVEFNLTNVQISRRDWYGVQWQATARHRFGRSGAAWKARLASPRASGSYRKAPSPLHSAGALQTVTESRNGTFCHRHSNRIAGTELSVVGTAIGAPEQ